MFKMREVTFKIYKISFKIYKIFCGGCFGLGGFEFFSYL